MATSYEIKKGTQINTLILDADIVAYQYALLSMQTYLLLENSGFVDKNIPVALGSRQPVLVVVKAP